MRKYKFVAFDRYTMQEIPHLDNCEVGENPDKAAENLARRLGGFVGGSGWTVFTKNVSYSPVVR